MYFAKYNVLQIGCETHSPSWWMKNYREVATEHDQLDIVDEYKLYINFAAKWWKLMQPKIKKAAKKTR